MQLAMQEKTLKGSSYGSARPRVDMARILDLYQKVTQLDTWRIRALNRRAVFNLTLLNIETTHD